MNIAVIFAGGVGKRMGNQTIPKQFLKLHGKEIIIYTIEHFEKCKDIDAIVIVCLSEWIPYLNNVIKSNHISKIKRIVAGGENGQESIYRGLLAAEEFALPDSIVLIHDGVRPLINQETILANIESVKRNGSAITVAQAIETIIRIDSKECVTEVINRSSCKLARAPQSFYLKQVLAAHKTARQQHLFDFIDTATLMQYYGCPLFTVEGPAENIKITTPNDFFTFKAYYEAQETSKILGL